MPPKHVKVKLTETVTAELITPAARPREPRGNAVTDAIATTNVIVGGAAPALAMGGGLLAVFTSAAHAAHGATVAQHSATTVLEASTVTGVAALLQVPTIPRPAAEPSAVRREAAKRAPCRCPAGRPCVHNPQRS